jgi:hypothetical protein
MSEPTTYLCQCDACLQTGKHPEKIIHARINLLLSRLDEQQRRWYVAVESSRVGHGGDRRLSRITGMNVETIRRGRREMDGSLRGRPTDRVRLPGGGRPPAEKKPRTSPGS